MADEIEVKAIQPAAQPTDTKKVSAMKVLKIISLVLLCPLVISYFIAFALNKIRMLETSALVGLGFYYGWRLGVGKFKLSENYIGKLPFKWELVIVAVIILAITFIMIARAKEKINTK